MMPFFILGIGVVLDSMAYRDEPRRSLNRELGLLNALNSMYEGAVRTHVPENSVCEFRHQAERPPTGVVHNPRRSIAVANVCSMYGDCL